MELDLPGSVGIIAPHRDTSSGYLSANQKKKSWDIGILDG
jgi:hypothetical protein